MELWVIAFVLAGSIGMSAIWAYVTLWLMFFLVHRSIQHIEGRASGRRAVETLALAIGSDESLPLPTATV